jgi:cyclase
VKILNPNGASVLGLMFLAMLSCSTIMRAQDPRTGRSSGPAVKGKVYAFEKIVDGVYYTTSDSSMAVGGNHTIIVGDQNVFLVDAGTTPAAARALLADMKLTTDKPVRWVVNTHFHYDHTDGNSIFGPEVEIIGTEYVRHMIADEDVLHIEPFKTSMAIMPAQVEALKKQIADERDSARRAALETQLAAKQSDWEELKMLKPTPPNVTYNTKMTVFQGTREIQLLFLGRGHTQGDTVVYLPKEQIVCSGDLMETQPAYMGNAFFDEWIATLDKMKELNFETMLPGHGVPFHNKALITAYQSYLKDLMNQVAALRKQGVSADDAAKKVDMTSHKADFPQIQGPGAEVRGIRRMYEWMDDHLR